MNALSNGSATSAQSQLPRPIHSLMVKLTLAFLAIGLAGALLVALFVGNRTQHAFDQFVDDRVAATLLTDLAQFYLDNGSWVNVGTLVERDLAAQSSTHRPVIVLLDANERIVLGDAEALIGANTAQSEHLRRVAIEVEDTVVGWLVSDVAPERPAHGTPETDFVDRVTQAVIYSAGGATMLALVLGSVLVKTLTRPLRELTLATQAVAQGELGRQVAVQGRDELGMLAGSFNQMSADLAQAQTLRRQMTADIAHDLRTPLSVILGYSEALRDGILPADQALFEMLHSEAQQLQHLVDDLRTLSLADAGELPLNRQRIQVTELLERTVANFQGPAQQQGVALQVHLEDERELSLDGARIAQVLDNLVSNALRYTPAGGTISLRVQNQGNAVQFQVADSGAGIAPHDLPHVFERFYRADTARQQDGSSGLGLALAKAIVLAHGGSIAVDSTLGLGTAFTLTLPAVPAERGA